MTYKEQSVIAVVMAAGKSQRFGADKRLARMTDGRCLLHATLGLARQHFAETWVVLGVGDDPEALGVGNEEKVVYAPADDIGLGTSLATAFGCLQRERTHAYAAAVMLGDMPWISGAICQRLIARAHPERILCPHYRGQTGHPVVFGRTFWPELSAVHGDNGARSILEAHPTLCEQIEVEGRSILKDVDVPADLH